MPTEREAYREHLIRHAPADAEARVEQLVEELRAVNKELGEQENYRLRLRQHIEWLQRRANPEGDRRERAFAEAASHAEQQLDG